MTFFMVTHFLSPFMIFLWYTYSPIDRIFNSIECKTFKKNYTNNYSPDIKPFLIIRVNIVYYEIHQLKCLNKNRNSGISTIYLNFNLTSILQKIYFSFLFFRFFELSTYPHPLQ